MNVSFNEDVSECDMNVSIDSTTRDFGHKCLNVNKIPNLAKIVRELAGDQTIYEGLLAFMMCNTVVTKPVENMTVSKGTVINLTAGIKLKENAYDIYSNL